MIVSSESRIKIKCGLDVQRLYVSNMHCAKSTQQNTRTYTAVMGCFTMWVIWISQREMSFLSLRLSIPEQILLSISTNLIEITPSTYLKSGSNYFIFVLFLNCNWMFKERSLYV